MGAEYLSGGNVAKWHFYFMEEKTGHGYYVTIPMIILTDERLSPNAKLLFGIIGNLANQRGYCFASNAYIGDLLGCHEVTISGYVKELLDAEYIIKFNEITPTGMQRRLRLNNEGVLANGLRGSKPTDLGGLSQETKHNKQRRINKEEYIYNTSVNETTNTPQIKTLGQPSELYVTIQPETLGSIKYRINGEDGLKEYFETNLSHIPRPEFTRKFLIDRNGKAYNSFKHLSNDFQVFIEKSFKR